MSITPTRVRRGLTDHQRFHARFPSYVRELGEERKRCNVLLQRLGRQDRQEQRGTVRKLLADRRLHRIFAFDAVRRSSGLWDATPETVSALASQFDAFRPVHEPYRTRNVHRNGGRRLVHDFGPRRRMQQSMVDRILRALHPPPERQTLFRGGIPMAHKAIAAAVADGYTFGVEVDLVAFYANVRRDALSDLLRPLPTSVVDAVVWDASARSRHEGDQWCASDPASSRFDGLSLGSACSPIVGERIIASVLAAAQLTDVVTFADNLFVYGRSEEDVSAKLQTLRNLEGDLSFGRLELRVSKERGFRLDWPFEFAKQEGRLEASKVMWSPGAHKLAEYQVSEAANLTFDQIAVAERRIRLWQRAYPDWQDGEAFAAEYLAALAVRRWYLNRHPTTLRRAVDAVLIAYHERLAVEPGYLGGLLAFIPETGDVLGDGRNRLVLAIQQHVEHLSAAA